MKNKATAEAVRAIRDHLRLNQADFVAHFRNRFSYATVQKYERVGPPLDKYETFIEIARELGREDLAGVFIEELRKKYGRYFDAPADDRTPSERHYCNILVDMLRSGTPEHVASLKGFLDAWPLAKKQRASKRNAG